MKKKHLLLLLLLALACGKKKDPEPDPEIPAPKMAVLTSPVQNEVCTSGEVLSDTESLITFVWKTAENAESYELSYKNLETGALESMITTTTKATVKLTSNTPYSWKIISKSSKTSAVATSEVWKFYNAGNGVVAYAPYPAELISPSLGSVITPVAGKISLTWKGADPDDDISSYVVYFGTAANPPLYKSDLNATSLTDVLVNNSTTYYWMVVTKDSKGNTSNSGISQFKTN